MRIHVQHRDGLAQANGLARDVYALLGLLLEAKAPRICVTVYGTGASVTWGLGL